jgi:Protein of unknwon function (DUF3310)
VDQISTSSRANDRQVGGNHYKEAAAVCPHCGGEIQHWDLFAKMPYLVGQVCKYVMRFLGKNGKQDLEKAGHFLQKLTEVYYPEKPDTAVLGDEARSGARGDSRARK